MAGHQPSSRRGGLVPQGFLQIFEEFPGMLEDIVSTSSEKGGLSLSEDENNIYVEAALPGLKGDDVEVSIENGVLWIKGERRVEEEDKNKKFYRRAQGSFSYSVTLPQEVNEDDPEATFKNGIMKVTFKRTKPPGAKKISFTE